jgi:methyl-accepting chemotaxis protein
MSAATDGVDAAMHDIDEIARANGEAAGSMLVHASVVIGELDGVRDVTETTAANARALSDAAEQLRSEAESLAGSSDSLVGTASGLSARTRQFRLPQGRSSIATVKPSVPRAGRRAA